MGYYILVDTEPLFPEHRPHPQPLLPYRLDSFTDIISERFLFDDARAQLDEVA